MTTALKKTTSLLLALAMAATLVVGLSTKDAFAAEKVDQSMYVPSIYSYEYKALDDDVPWATLGLLCPGNEFGTRYTGFQAYVSDSADFSNPRKIYSDHEWNRQGYAHLSVLSSWVGDNLYGGTTYYIKVRSYKNADGSSKPGDSSTYGPWSAVTTIDIPYYGRHLSGNAKYTYELYALSNVGASIYDGCTIPLYIKTDNPDPSSFDFVTNAEMLGTMTDGSEYPDIDFTDEYIYTQAKLRRVEGGYIWLFNTETSGKLEFEVREYQKDGYVIADKFNLEVNDYEAARDAWMDSIIAQATTPAMDKFQKMQAICDYLLPRFKYLTNDGNGNALVLASQPDGPYFLTNRWDSYISPAALCQFAERIGGFTKIDNLYGHYADYGYSWASGHMLCYCSDGTREAFYKACPLTPTGAVTYSAIDLSNSGSIYKVNGIQKLAFENPAPSTPGTPDEPTAPDTPTTPTNPTTPDTPTTPANPTTPSTPDVAGIEMFRLYNPNSGEHFYTASETERDSLWAGGWNYEGVEWTAPEMSSTPVYRLYSGTDHHYTMSANERDALVAAGWSYEGIGWYSDDAQGVPLYRQFNPNVDPGAPTNNSGSHNYTTSEAEHWALVAIGWIAEDVGWYGMAS